ncbi:hypothetical protein D3C72_1047290 [compost metagenome]
MQAVPLTSASPSFAAGAQGARPASASASAAGIVRPAMTTVPWPSIAWTMCESGTRSPLAPTDPQAGTTGVMPALRSAKSRSAVSTRAPEWPWAIEWARKSIIARTTGTGSGSPQPTRSESSTWRWSAVRSASST